MSKKKKSQPNGLKILFADDEVSLQNVMRLELPRLGHEVTVCPDGLTAAAALEKNVYDCILVDMDMPGMHGIEVLTLAKTETPDTEAIVMTGNGSKETAIAALKQGAFDYLTKPCTLAEIDAVLQRVTQKRELSNKYRALQKMLVRAEGEPNLVGSAKCMDKVRDLISKVAPTESTVLILGETGTGKELVARAVHDQSLRHDKPFVAINCGALPENLIESELFGHRKGAFTGADDHRVGLFEVANGGTIFLDEIGELPKSMQAKLLRVLETGDIRRVGDNEAFHVDVRAVCATHRNLVEMVEEGDFREDLMYRINTFEVHLPPLRNRVEDIAELAEHLYRRKRSDARAGEKVLTDEAINALTSHVWPGNVRELANVIEHASILCDSPPIGVEHLPSHFDSRGLSQGLRVAATPMTLRDLELQAIHESLERHDGNKPAVAEELGVSVKTLYNKLNQAAALKRAA